uniref:Uncharacterized protein n=1 Tax=Anguilla anguilla TaxID=7936 RepID=A0A0E9S7R1_ANGAN
MLLQKDNQLKKKRAEMGSERKKKDVCVLL